MKISLYLCVNKNKNTMKKLMGVILLSTWTFLFIFFCGTDGPVELPFTITSPILVSVCFFIVFFTSPIISIYLMRDKK